ncbi:putative PRO41 protein, partial [Rhypophila sp. PSN 637]
MERLAKAHWARLLVLSAATCQIVAATHSFFWPKITWNFATRSLDFMIYPFPALQCLNLLTGLFVLLREWPVYPVAGPTSQNITFRLVVLVTAALFCSLLYQGLDVALYYLLASATCYWAYISGNV